MNTHEEIINYFSPKSKEETMLIKLSEYENIKYYNIEKIFNLYYHLDSLLVAKISSMNERNTNDLKDSCYVYGEVVNII